MKTYLYFNNDVTLELPDFFANSMDSEEFRKLIAAVKNYAKYFDAKVVWRTPDGDIPTTLDQEVTNK